MSAERAAATLPSEQLERLEELVERSLLRDEEAALPVLGYGEISLVLAWPPGRPAFACKRLPPFADRGRFEAYRTGVSDYVERLRAAQVSVVPTELRGVERPGGAIAAYVVQPMLPATQLGPQVLARADPERGHPLVPAIVSATERVIGPRLGLDAQLSNWTWDGSEPTYLDVSTPLAWSPEGRPQLDLELLAQAYPAPLRPPLRRFLGPRILDGYRDLREVYVDLMGNLIKERLEPWVPRFLEAIGERVEPPIEPDQVRRYYRSDARLWAALLRIRRLDRAWQRRVRRRPYPFLLPGEIER